MLLSPDSYVLHSCPQARRNRHLVNDNGAWSAEALLRAPDLVRDVHDAFARAGADVVTANSYACTHHYLQKIGQEAALPELVRLAVRLAREGALKSNSLLG